MLRPLRWRGSHGSNYSAPWLSTAKGWPKSVPIRRTAFTQLQRSSFAWRLPVLAMRPPTLSEASATCAMVSDMPATALFNAAAIWPISSFESTARVFVKLPCAAPVGNRDCFLKRSRENTCHPKTERHAQSNAGGKQADSRAPCSSVKLLIL